MALRAYRHHLEQINEEEDLHMFFVGAGQRYCASADFTLVQFASTKYSVHSPAPIRVDVALGMVIESRRAFQCDPMKPFGKYQMTIDDSCDVWEIETDTNV